MEKNMSSEKEQVEDLKAMMRQAQEALKGLQEEARDAAGSDSDLNMGDDVVGSGTDTESYQDSFDNSDNENTTPSCIGNAKTVQKPLSNVCNNKPAQNSKTGHNRNVSSKRLLPDRPADKSSWAKSKSKRLAWLPSNNKTVKGGEKRSLQPEISNQEDADQAHKALRKHKPAFPFGPTGGPSEARHLATEKAKILKKKTEPTPAVGQYEIQIDKLSNRRRTAAPLILGKKPPQEALPTTKQKNQNYGLESGKSEACVACEECWFGCECLCHKSVDKMVVEVEASVSGSPTGSSCSTPRINFSQTDTVPITAPSPRCSLKVKPSDEPEMVLKTIPDVHESLRVSVQQNLRDFGVHDQLYKKAHPEDLGCVKCDARCWWGCNCRCHRRCIETTVLETPDQTAMPLNELSAKTTSKVVTDDDLGTLSQPNSPIAVETPILEEESTADTLVIYQPLPDEEGSMDTVPDSIQKVPTRRLSRCQSASESQKLFTKTSEFRGHRGSSFGKSRRDTLGGMIQAWGLEGGGSMIDPEKARAALRPSTKGGSISRTPRKEKCMDEEDSPPSPDPCVQEGSKSDYTKSMMANRPRSISAIIGPAPKPPKPPKPVPGPGSYEPSHSVIEKRVTGPKLLVQPAELKPEAKLAMAVRNVKGAGPGQYNVDKSDKIVKQGPIGGKILPEKSSSARPRPEDDLVTDKEEMTPVVDLSVIKPRAASTLIMPHEPAGITWRNRKAIMLARAQKEKEKNVGYHEVDFSIVEETVVAGPNYSKEANIKEWSKKRLAEKPVLRQVLAEKSKAAESRATFLGPQLQMAWAQNDTPGQEQQREKGHHLTVVNRRKPAFRYVEEAQPSQLVREKRGKDEQEVAARDNFLPSQLQSDWKHQNKNKLIDIEKHIGREEVKIKHKDQVSRTLFTEAIRQVDRLGPGVHDFETAKDRILNRASVANFSTVTGRHEAVGPYGERPEEAVVNEYAEIGVEGQNLDIDAIAAMDLLRPIPEGHAFAKAGIEGNQDLDDSILNEGDVLDLDVNAARDMLEDRSKRGIIKFRKQQGRGEDFNEPYEKPLSDDDMEGQNLELSVQIEYIQPRASSVVFPKASRQMDPQEKKQKEGDILVLSPHDSPIRKKANAVDMRKQLGRWDDIEEEQVLKRFNEADEREITEAAIEEDIRRSKAAETFRSQGKSGASRPITLVNIEKQTLFNDDISKDRHLGPGIHEFDVAKDRLLKRTSVPNIKAGLGRNEVVGPHGERPKEYMIHEYTEIGIEGQVLDLEPSAAFAALNPTREAHTFAQAGLDSSQNLTDSILQEGDVLQLDVNAAKDALREQSKSTMVQFAKQLGRGEDFNELYKKPLSDEDIEGQNLELSVHDEYLQPKASAVTFPRAPRQLDVEGNEDVFKEGDILQLEVNAARDVLRDLSRRRIVRFEKQKGRGEDFNNAHEQPLSDEDVEGQNLELSVHDECLRLRASSVVFPKAPRHLEMDNNKSIEGDKLSLSPHDTPIRKRSNAMVDIKKQMGRAAAGKKHHRPERSTDHEDPKGLNEILIQEDIMRSTAAENFRKKASEQPFLVNIEMQTDKFEKPKTQFYNTDVHLDPDNSLASQRPRQGKGVIQMTNQNPRWKDPHLPVHLKEKEKTRNSETGDSLFDEKGLTEVLIQEEIRRSTAATTFLDNSAPRPYNLVNIKKQPERFEKYKPAYNDIILEPNDSKVSEKPRKGKSILQMAQQQSRWKDPELPTYLKHQTLALAKENGNDSDNDEDIIQIRMKEDIRRSTAAEHFLKSGMESGFSRPLTLVNMAKQTEKVEKLKPSVYNDVPIQPDNDVACHRPRKDIGVLQMNRQNPRWKDPNIPQHFKELSISNAEDEDDIDAAILDTRQKEDIRRSSAAEAFLKRSTAGRLTLVNIEKQTDKFEKAKSSAYNDVLLEPDDSGLSQRPRKSKGILKMADQNSNRWRDPTLPQHLKGHLSVSKVEDDDDDIDDKAIQEIRMKEDIMRSTAVESFLKSTAVRPQNVVNIEKQMDKFEKVKHAYNDILLEPDDTHLSDQPRKAKGIVRMSYQNSNRWHDPSLPPHLKENKSSTQQDGCEGPGSK